MAIVSLWALYAIAMNVFLSTSLFEKVVDGDARTIWVGFRRGWSIVPGTVHARDLAIRSSDSNVEWILRIDEVRFEVSLFDLARKRFTVKDVRGSGVELHLRSREPSPAVTSDHVANVPPIPGFGRLPIRPPEPPGPEVWDDEAWSLWTIRLDDVIAEHVRDVWIDRQRFLGDARVEGGFYLKPIREVRAGPITTDIAEGRVLVDGQPLVPELRGRTRLVVDAFDPRVVSGGDLLHRVSLETDLRLRADLRYAPARLVQGARLSGALDAPRFALAVERGIVRPETALDARLAQASFERDDVRATLEALTVRSAEGSERIDVEIDATGGDLAGVGKVPSAHAHVDARAIDLADPAQGTHATLAIPEADVPDARGLDRFVPKTDTPLGFASGRATVRADLEAWPGDRRARGAATLRADALAVTVAKVRVHGETDAELRVGELVWDGTAHAKDVSLDAKVRTAAVGPSTGEAAGRYVVAKGIDLSAAGARIDLDDPLRAFSAKVTVDEGRIIDRGLLAAYLPKGDETKLEEGDARFSARAEVDIEDHRARGTLDASAPALGLVLGDVHLTAALRAHARVHDWAWDRGDLVVDRAAIDVEHVEARTRTERAALAVRRIAIRGKSPRFSFSDPLGRADLTARIEGGEVRDAAAMNAFLPSDASFGLESKDGTFSADVRASITRHVAHGKVTARARRVGAGGERLHVTGDIDVAADVKRWGLDDNRLSLEHAKVEVARAEGRFGSGPRSDFTAPRIVLDGRTDRLDLAHPSLRGADFRLVIDGAELPDARSLGALLPPGEAVGFESGRARAEADIRVSSSKRLASGIVSVRAERARLRTGDVRLEGDFTVAGTLRGFDPDASRVDVTGSRIAARGVSVVGSSADTKAWRGDITVLGGSVVLGERPSFDARVRFTADDASPLLALALKDSLPGFLVDLVRAPRLDARARVTLAPDTLAVREIEAHGGDVGVRGSVVVRGERQEGGLVVEKGPVSAGVDFADDGASLELFDLDDWLKSERTKAKHLLEER